MIEIGQYQNNEHLKLSKKKQENLKAQAIKMQARLEDRSQSKGRKNIKATIPKPKDLKLIAPMIQSKKLIKPIRRPMLVENIIDKSKVPCEILSD